MTTLHLINSDMPPPLPIKDSDAILFIENGVYQQSAGSYVLADDLHARGLEAATGVTVVDYAGFVDLCTQFEKVVSW